MVIHMPVSIFLFFACNSVVDVNFSGSPNKKSTSKEAESILTLSDRQTCSGTQLQYSQQELGVMIGTTSLR